ncbi:MAG: DUF3987 domain-containing protein [Candidatus Cloacimonadaceae bacterium]
MHSNYHQQPLQESGAMESRAAADNAPVAWEEQLSSVTPLSKLPVRSSAELEAEELLDLFGKPRPVPLNEDFLPPVVGEYLKLTKSCTDAKPGMLVTAWLPFAAVNLGNRVFMLNKHARIYPNIWSCLIGRSGISRKTTALKFAGYSLQPYESSLDELTAVEYERQTLLMNSITLSKMLSYLAENPCRLFVHNEIGSWLAEMNKSFNASYKQTVTELYDGVDRTVSNRERFERIRKPALSIAAATTDVWLYKNVGDSAELLSGFLQRFLFYNAGEIELGDIDLSLGADYDLAEVLAGFERNYFRLWRAIPAGCQLRLSEEAREFRDLEYAKLYARVFRRNNDALLSYFTRIYDGYWFKFCIIDTLAENAARLKIALEYNQTGEFFAEELRVSGEAAIRAMELCNFYLRNTIPLLRLLEDQDKLAGERRLVELIVHKYSGKAPHTKLMNSAHMTKREFGIAIETLIEREAVRVETYNSGKRPGKLYVIAPEIYHSWYPGG